MKIIILGPPGSGKGTQAKMVAQEFNYRHISTGDILREAVREETPIGKKAEKYLKRGKLVPDKIMLELIEESIYGSNKWTDFILDGFPRTITQAKELNMLLEKHSDYIDLVLYLSIDEETLVKRLSSRRICKNCQSIYNLIINPPKVEGICDNCGGKLIQREDDKPEIIRVRLEVYKEQTEPLIEFYKSSGRLKEVKADKSPEEVNKLIKKEVGSSKK